MVVADHIAVTTNQGGSMTAIAVQTASFLSRNKPLLYCIGAAVSLITMGAFHIMEDPYELGH